MIDRAALRQGRGRFPAALLLLAVAAWAVVVWQATGADPMDMRPVLFIGSWTVMMAAMMLPAATPMLLTFDRIQAGKRRQGSSAVPTWVFLAGYLLVWAAFGAVALEARGLAHWAGLVLEGPAATGALLALAGLYQFSPLKHACLRWCRTPLGFVMGHWRDGSAGALRMGVQHGLYCLGCCWPLFLLFPLGLMNLPAMLAVTALVSVEKVFPAGPVLARAAGAGLVAWGLATLVRATLG